MSCFLETYYSNVELYVSHGVFFNENNTLPTGIDAEIMKTFVKIAKKTGQWSEIMNFPPIDHDSPIRYVLSYKKILKIQLYIE